VTVEDSVSLSLDEVRVGDAYESVRGDERRRVADLQRLRRIRLGDALALVFENRDTIRSTVEEALRTERIEEPGRVADEIAAFNAVMPAPGELAAALFLEVADPADVNAAVMRFHGIEHTVFLEVGGTRSRGIPEEVFPQGESAVAHYLRFRIEPGQREAILGGSSVVAGSDHPTCAIRVALDEDQRQAIAADL
jgi:Protein of unknown function (DUF3501)